MAVTTTQSPARSMPVHSRAQSAPGWIFIAYLAGLVLVYGGERVLSGLPKGAGFVSALGVLLALAATALRFVPRFRSGGERKSIESLLAVLSVIGLLGLLIYFTTSDAFAPLLGLEQLATERRTEIEELARVVWVSLIVISVVPMVFAESALLPMRNADRPESRRVRSAATAGLSLALAGIYGALFVYAASGVDWRVDYSYFRTSKPSESTKRLVASLGGDPIRVVAFFPDVNEVRSEVEGYLREVARGAPKLKVEVTDRLLVPKLAKELRATQDGVIVLSRGTVNQTLNIGADVDQARPKLKTLDRDFQEQLLKIARSKRTAYLTVGHGELNDAGRRSEGDGRSAQIVRTLLQKQNYTLRDLGLAQGLGSDVPGDADIVLVLGPTAPFSREELAALRRYADRGGRLVLALDPDAIPAQGQLSGAEHVTREAAAAAQAGAAGTPANTKAPGAAAGGSGAPGAAVASPPGEPVTSFNQELAAIVGLTFHGDVLANDKQHVRVRYNDSDRTRIISNSFSSHASVSTLSRNAPRAAIVLFGSGSLEQLPGTNAKADFAVRSMTGTFQDKNRNYALDTGAEKAAVFNLGAAVTRPVAAAAAKAEPKKDDAAKPGADKKPSEKTDASEFRAFVLADADALSDFVLAEVPGNQVLLVDAMRWLLGEESVQGLPNTEEDVRIEHTKQADLGWFYLIIFGIPGLVLGSGLLVSKRSRGRGGRR